MTQKQLIDQFCEFRGKCTTDDVVALNFAYEMLAPHWISVEDELPKNKELVFITDGEYTDTGFYEYTFDEWQPCEKWLGDITHWMPLPQAPTVAKNATVKEKGD